MIAKINHIKFLGPVLKYNNDKVSEGEAECIGSDNIRWYDFDNPDKSLTDDDIWAEFKGRLDKCKCEKPIVHISLNPHLDDVLDDFDYRDIAEEYLEKMGYKGQPYVVYRHNDIAREHIHIVTTSIGEDGKELTIENGKRQITSFDKRRSESVTRELEQKYKLIPADSSRVKAKMEKTPINIKSEISLLETIKNNVQYCLHNYMFSSINEYVAYMNLQRIDCKLTTKKNKDGKDVATGIAYTAIDENGTQISKAIPASEMGKDYAPKDIYKHIRKNQDALKVRIKKSTTKDRIYNILERSHKSVFTSRASHFKHFTEQLKKEGIDILFRTNEQGRIYGVTIVDDKEKIIANGSKFGRELSANIFNDIFGNESNSSSFGDIVLGDAGKLFENILGGGYQDFYPDEIGINQLGIGKQEEAEGAKIEKKKKRKKRPKL